MKIEFIKDCPWSYRLTFGQRGRVTKHKQGETAQVADVEGESMVAAGYAIQCKPGRKPGYQPEEHKVVDPEVKKTRKKKGGK